MSRLYDICVIGRDDPGTWLAAAALSAKDISVALMLERPPDPSLLPFYWLAADPLRSRALAEPFGLAPASAPSLPGSPDFQVVFQGKPVDFVAPSPGRSIILERDLGQTKGSFEKMLGNLSQKGANIIKEAVEAGYPGKTGKGLLGKLFQGISGKVYKGPDLSPFTGMAGELDEFPRQVLELALSGMYGAPLGDSAPASLLALLCYVIDSFSEKDEGQGDFREQAAKLITRRGAIMEGEPESLLSESKKITGVRLAGSTVVEARFFMAPRKVLNKLSPTAKKGEGPKARRTTRATFFFKIDVSTVPESWAPRSVIFSGNGGNKDKIMVVCRSRRVPRRETMAVTVYDERGELNPEDLPALLKAGLPWLDEKAVHEDEDRKPERYSKLLPDGLGEPYRYSGKLVNILPLPSEVIPGWGHAGIVAVLAAQMPLMLGKLDGN